MLSSSSTGTETARRGSFSNKIHPSIQSGTIAQSPDFYILTALLWIRFPPTRATSIDSRALPTNPATGKDDVYGLIHRDTATDLEKPTVIDDSLPDLGLLPLHRDRLITAAEALGWRNLECFKTNSRGLDRLQLRIQQYLSSLPPLHKQQREYRKLRISISRGGNVRIDSAVINTMSAALAIYKPPFMPRSFDEISSHSTIIYSRVYLDTVPTRPSAFTTHKTTYRIGYDEARERANVSHSLPTDGEVLLYNLHDEVMETSVCTIYFRRNDDWITPAAICGGNVGVSRRLALENGLCKQGVIELKDVQEGEEVWLSNAVRGFFRGKIARFTEHDSTKASVHFDAMDWASSPTSRRKF